MSSFSASKKTLIKLIIVQWGLVVIFGLTAWIVNKPENNVMERVNGITPAQHVYVDEMIASLVPNGALIEDNKRQAEFFLYAYRGHQLDGGELQ